MTNNSVVSASQNPEFIAIDWEIHQLIELERRSFEEPPIEALRRMLGLVVGQKPRIRIAASNANTAEQDDAAADWTSKGVTIPNGTKARFNYRHNSKPIFGEFKGGKLHAAGRVYDSLSAAANDLAVTRAGKKTSLNGWIYWSVEMPNGSGNWLIMDHLRKGKDA